MKEMKKFDVVEIKMINDFKNKDERNFSLKGVNYPQIIKG